MWVKEQCIRNVRGWEKYAAVAYYYGALWEGILHSKEYRSERDDCKAKCRTYHELEL